MSMGEGGGSPGYVATVKSWLIFHQLQLLQMHKHGPSMLSPSVMDFHPGREGIKIKVVMLVAVHPVLGCPAFILPLEAPRCPCGG